MKKLSVRKTSIKKSSIRKPNQRTITYLLATVAMICFHACVSPSHREKPIEMTGESVTPWLTQATSAMLCTHQLTQLTAKQLLQRDCKALDIEQFLALAQSASYTEQLVVWKGANEGVLTSPQGRPLKITFSVYGGFFKLEGMSGIYTVADKHRTAWYTMLDKAK